MKYTQILHKYIFQDDLRLSATTTDTSTPSEKPSEALKGKIALKKVSFYIPDENKQQITILHKIRQDRYLLWFEGGKLKYELFQATSSDAVPPVFSKIPEPRDARIPRPKFVKWDLFLTK